MSEDNAIIDSVIAMLRQMYDPEIPLNIYDLGLIYDIAIRHEEGKTVCVITMTLTSPACPIADTLLEQVGTIDKLVDAVDEVYIDLVFDPPWSEERISYEGKLELGLL